MKFDDITFRFRLLVIEPIELCLKINTIIQDQEYFNIGRHEISTKILTSYHDNYSVSLATVNNVSKPSAIIENLAVTWNDDYKITPFCEEQKENEIWNYSGYDDQKKFLEFQNSYLHRTINLEYKLDNKRNGFINNYGYFRHSDGRIDSLVNNGNHPYIISSAGEFIFNFKSPIAYWLLERLFVDSKNF